MTVRITVNRICDRCLRPFAGTQHESVDDLPEFEAQDQHILTRTDRKTGEVKTLFDYRDLCDSCDGVVTKALAKLRMSRVETDRAAFDLDAPVEESSPKSEVAPEKTAVEPEVKPDPVVEESSPKKQSRKDLAAAVARKTEKKLAQEKLEASERQARLDAQAAIQKQREEKEAELEVVTPPPDGGSSDLTEDDLPF